MAKPIGISLDATDATPIFRQIADQILHRIRTGAFPEGHRLPPTRSLAAELATHRNTVVRAYEELAASGVVESVVGRGTFVAAGAPAATPARQSPSPSLPWESLVTNSPAAEPLKRFAQFARAAPAGDAIDLARMQPSPDLLPADLLRRAIDHVLRTRGARALGYAPREGLPRLRALIADDLTRRGVPARADDVVITSGSQQAIDLVARMLVRPGDAFLVNHSTYGGAIDVLQASGARLVGVPSDGEGPDLEALDRLAALGAKGLYLMPNCANPTGEVVSARRREALVAWSHRARVPILEDDYGANLTLDDGPHPPALRALDGNVIHLGTFSKQLIPALRIGYVLCPPAVRQHLISLKHAVDLGTSALLQHALAEFLDRGYMRAHVRRVSAEYRARRDALEGQLGASLPRQFRWRSPRTGVLLWLPLPAEYRAEPIVEEARRRGVVVTTGAQFAAGIPPEEGLRLTFCFEPPERLVEAARRLGAAVAAAAPPRRARRAAAEAVATTESTP